MHLAGSQLPGGRGPVSIRTGHFLQQQRPLLPWPSHSGPLLTVPCHLAKSLTVDGFLSHGRP